MSADNGDVIRVHPKGGFATMMYFASNAEEYMDALYGKVPDAAPQFETLVKAILHAEGKDDGSDVDPSNMYYGYGSEYGYELGPDVLSQLNNSDLGTYTTETRCPHCGGQIRIKTAVSPILD